MFGYVTVCRDELKLKHLRRYRAYYCGLCHALGERTGLRGRMLLTYDLTFLAVLIRALSEEEIKEEERRCVAHPFKKHLEISGECTEYAADMSLLLAYHKFLDDAEDDGSKAAAAAARSIRKSYRSAAEKYPEKAKEIEAALKRLRAIEERGDESLDAAAGEGGRITAAAFDTGGIWADVMKELGFYLGKFIYLMDAYDDLENDLKKGRYNPWKYRMGEEGFEDAVKSTLELMAAEASAAYEKLPVVEESEILRNILYCGIWMKYGKTAEARREKAGSKANDSGSV